MRVTAGRALGAVLALCLLACGPALARSGRGGPGAHAARSLQTVARGLQTTTAFAFGAGRIFAAEEPTAEQGPGGGVFVLGNGRGRMVYRGAAFGVAWHDGALYVSAVYTLVRLSGWDGHSFRHQTTLYTGSANFTGFTGIGFGADGRLYAGVYLGANDHSPTSAPYAFDVLSFNANGGDLRVVSRGLRQPWQLAFPAGSSSPYVSVLGQDSPAGVTAPDFIARATPGANFGFPACNWLIVSACHGDTRPSRFFAAHTDVGGLAIVGHTLYAGEFGYVSAHPPRVIALPIGHGGATRTVLSGFPQPIIGLAADHGWLYVGGANGTVFRGRP